MKKLIVWSALVCTLLITAGAQASIAREYTYSENTVWRCAVRFIRVDKGFQVVEKDKETGYLLFEYTDGARTTNGSLEVLRVVKNNRAYVRVQMNLHGQPKYVESLLFKKLERKLKSEYGVAPAARYVDPPKEPAAETDDKSESDAEAVDEDVTEEELRITEDDLNQNTED